MNYDAECIVVLPVFPSRVDLCLLLRSILQFRPTARISVEAILRHDWLQAQDAKPRVKSQVRLHS